MSDKTAAQFKKLLLARRAELARNLAHPVDDEPAASLDEAALAPASIAAEPRATNVSARALLHAFDAALSRIADGTYGACAVCGGEIGTRRLVAFPWARHCLACQARVEKQR
ncbi:MAG: TraR/DksA family transcriptional regulator [Terriglobales bacterium]